MTTEPAMNPEANTDDIDAKVTMGEVMALETAQRAAANPPTVAPIAAEPSPVFKPLTAGSLDGTQRNDIDMILNIPIQLTVKLGRIKVPIKNLLQLAQGSVVELDALADEPMDVLVNGYLITQDEVMAVDKKFGIRLIDIITLSEHIRKLNR